MFLGFSGGALGLFAQLQTSQEQWNPDNPAFRSFLDGMTIWDPGREGALLRDSLSMCSDPWPLLRGG